MYDGTGKQKTATLAPFETTRECDVDISFDLLIPSPSRESKRILGQLLDD